LAPKLPVKLAGMDNQLLRARQVITIRTRQPDERAHEWAAGRPRQWPSGTVGGRSRGEDLNVLMGARIEVHNPAHPRASQSHGRPLGRRAIGPLVRTRRKQA